MNHKSYYMNMALKLAKKGIFTTTSNPCVGCVLVNKGHLVGIGYHKRVGQPHAEAFAIENADDFAEGSTAFVTLEPCAHHGKNPPCAEALIKAKVSKVIICNVDPNPLVAGKGIAKLEAAGIKVKVGVQAKKGKFLNRGFFHRMTTGLPFIRLKMAQSLDGRTAMHNGDSYWITGKKARRDVQYWRARSQAILTSVKTVNNDDCRLTVRADDLPKKYQSLPHDFDHYQPMRVILDSHCSVNIDAQIFNQVGRTVVITASNHPQKIRKLQAKNIEVLSMPSTNNKVDLSAVLRWLGEQQVNELMVEAGAELAGAFLQQQLIDQLIIYTAPVIMGNSARPLFQINIEEINNRLHIDDFEIKKMGKDWRLIAEL